MVGTAAKTLRDCDAVMVVEEGKPIGVLTRTTYSDSCRRKPAPQLLVPDCVGWQIHSKVVT